MDRRRFLTGALASVGGATSYMAKAQTNCYSPQPNNRCYTQKMIQDAFDCFGKLAQRYAIPGLSVAIAEKGSIIFNGVVGFSDASKSKPLTPGNKFRFASLSKPITSMAVMRELRNGLQLSDLISTYLSGRFQTSSYMLTPSRFSTITLQQLLTHTSGLRNLGCGDEMFHDRGLTRSQFGTKLLRHLPFETNQNNPYEYSNVGYFLLGEYLAERYQTSYEDFVKTRLFAPAGAQLEMSLGVGKALTDEVSYFDDVPATCSSSDFAPWKLDVNRMSAHGGWVGTPSALAKIVSQADTLLSVNDIATMTAPTAANPSYACGWNITGTSWWHLGGLPGTAAALLRTPNGISYVSVANTRMMSANTNNYVLPNLSASDMTAPGNQGLPAMLDNLNQALRQALQLG